MQEVGRASSREAQTTHTPPPPPCCVSGVCHSCTGLSECLVIPTLVRKTGVLTLTPQRGEDQRTHGISQCWAFNSKGALSFWGCSDASEPRALVRLPFRAAWRARSSPLRDLLTVALSICPSPAAQLQTAALAPSVVLALLNTNGFHQRLESHTRWVDLLEVYGSSLLLC